MNIVVGIVMVIAGIVTFRASSYEVPTLDNAGERFYETRQSILGWSFGFAMLLGGILGILDGCGVHPK